MGRRLNTKEKILRTYIKLHKKLSNVRWSDLGSKDITRAAVRHHFQSLAGLDEMARKKYPEKFKDIHIDNLITPKLKAKLTSTVSKYKRFIITTVVTGCEVDKKALASVRNYCKKRKAKLLVLVCSDPAHRTAKEGGYGTIDKILADELIITEDTELNSNFFINTIKTTAKQINPIVGLGRIGQREGSFVYASPKQMLKVEATSSRKPPKAIMTTGAISKSNYSTDMYMSERLAYLADHDHKMGAIVVEIKNEKIFHYRQIQFDKQGRFVDLGMMYGPNFIKKYAMNTLIPGDWHSGETDPQVKKVIFEMLDEFSPYRVIIHDGFNGLSINHHEEGNTVLKAKRFELNQTDLSSELAYLADDLNEFNARVTEVVMSKSNHDDFLNLYLSKCDFRYDPQNLRIALELAGAMLDNKDPVKYGVEKFNIKNPNQIKWLKRDEDFRIAGIECGAHGDKGSNGSRGTLENMEKAYGKGVFAHSHTPGILRDAWAVGTSTYLHLLYNIGASSWLHTTCHLYPNGMRQLINIIDGEYTID